MTIIFYVIEQTISEHLKPDEIIQFETTIKRFSKQDKLSMYCLLESLIRS